MADIDIRDNIIRKLIEGSELGLANSLTHSQIRRHKEAMGQTNEYRYIKLRKAPVYLAPSEYQYILDTYYPPARTMSVPPLGGRLTEQL